MYRNRAQEQTPKSKPYLVGENPCLLREGKEMILLGDTNCDFTKKYSDQDQLVDNNARYIVNVYG